MHNKKKKEEDYDGHVALNKIDYKNIGDDGIENIDSDSSEYDESAQVTTD